MFPYTNKKEVTFNVKYEIVLYTPVFNARWGVSVPHKNDDVIYEQPLTRVSSGMVGVQVNQGA